MNWPPRAMICAASIIVGLIAWDIFNGQELTRALNSPSMNIPKWLLISTLLSIIVTVGLLFWAAFDDIKKAVSRLR